MAHKIGYTVKEQVVLKPEDRANILDICPDKNTPRSALMDCL